MKIIDFLIMILIGGNIVGSLIKPNRISAALGWFLAGIFYYLARYLFISFYEKEVR